MIENDTTHKTTSLTLNPSAAIATDPSLLALFAAVVAADSPAFLAVVCGPSSLTQRLSTTIDDGDLSEEEFVGAAALAFL